MGFFYIPFILYDLALLTSDNIYCVSGEVRQKVISRLITPTFFARQFHQAQTMSVYMEPLPV